MTSPVERELATLAHRAAVGAVLELCLASKEFFGAQQYYSGATLTNWLESQLAALKKRDPSRRRERRPRKPVVTIDQPPDTVPPCEICGRPMPCPGRCGESSWLKDIKYDVFNRPEFGPPGVREAAASGRLDGETAGAEPEEGSGIPWGMCASCGNRVDKCRCEM